MHFIYYLFCLKYSKKKKRARKENWHWRVKEKKKKKKKKRTICGICNLMSWQKKKKKKKREQEKENRHWLVKEKKIKKIKFQKKKKKEPFVGYIIWWVEIELSHWATKLRSRAKTISRSEPLSRDPNYWVMIWPSQAKPRSTSSYNLSHWAEIRAIKPRYESSQVEPHFWAIIYQTQRFH